MDQRQFSTRDLFWAVTLFAAAFGLLTIVPALGSDAVGLVMVPVTPILGAAIGALFRRKLAGACYGLIIMIATVIFGSLLLPSVHS